MPLITVTAPVTTRLRAQINVPEEALDDIAGWLDENEDVLEDLLSRGRTDDYHLNLLDLEIED